MIRLFPGILGILLASCTSEKEQSESVRWKPRYSATECKALLDIDAITARCGDGNFERAAAVLNSDPSSCLPYSSARLFTGVWVRGFEKSAFYEGARDYDEVAERIRDYTNHPYTWFEPMSRAQIAFGTLPPPDEGQAFYVEVIGKRSLCEGDYGHMGGASHKIIATDLISAHSIRMAR